MHFILFSQIIYMILYVVFYLLFINIYINIFSHWTVVKWQYFYNENCIGMKGFLPRRGARGQSATALGTRPVYYVSDKHYVGLAK